jgi:nucleotide-binding universal stress UspA family protein
LKEVQKVKKVMAAIDSSPAAPGVLSVADAVAATLFDGDVEALHVRDNSDLVALSAADEAGFPLRIESGPTVSSIVTAAEANDVAAVVVGSRSKRVGARPAGHTALEIMTSVEKPLFTVPPDTHLPYVLKRLLVPLDASATSAAAARETLLLGCRCGLDMVVLHVHDIDTLPMFDDHPHHETRAWIDEFIARNCPQSVDVAVELRIGHPHQRVLEVARETQADLIILGWAQDFSPGRAATVRKTLADSIVPVLLLPNVARRDRFGNFEEDEIRLGI